MVLSDTGVVVFEIGEKMDLDVSSLRQYFHVANSSLMYALSISVFFARGKYIYIDKAMLASAAFALAGMWFSWLGATAHEHALISRANVVQLLAALEGGFMVLGWGWFALAFKRSFKIERKKQTA